ncbi:hypothetical protein Goshw_008739 [Gossypium schwendimanii]|uniref:Uncharacterized protein n=1 Tax=Gossypium schwendimanii TaxID=34291 RepID=A0A7J9MAW7_GOSSC|nr:hypothetical protein [Gossypium schwendimanii]
MENPSAHFTQSELVDQPSAPVVASSNVSPLACRLPHSLPSSKIVPAIQFVTHGEIPLCPSLGNAIPMLTSYSTKIHPLFKLTSLSIVPTIQFMTHGEIPLCPLLGNEIPMLTSYSTKIHPLFKLTSLS